MELETRPSKFYAQIDLLIDWEKIEATINRYYTKGNTLKGEKPYSGLLLFKMLFIEIWNGLSDVETEEHLNNFYVSQAFCGINLEEKMFDDSTLNLFMLH